MQIEEYFKKRLKDDKLDILNLKEKDQNMQLCINYIFDYFNTYVTADNYQKKIIADNEKLEKYSKSLDLYSEEVRNWLLKIYSEHNKRMNTLINNILKEDSIFLLISAESEFRKVSYKCYSRLIKKHAFLEDYIEELYLYILDIHRIWSNNYSFITEYGHEQFVSFNNKIDKLVKDTLKNYHVNLLSWADYYADYFFSNEHLWPSYAIRKEEYGYKYYEVTKAKRNIFNMDELYSRISSFKYIKGKKKILEILVMYYWNQSIEEIDDEYYKNYMQENIWVK